MTKTIDNIKLRIANILNLHEEPVFMCPVDGCTHTGNYGREIWNHLYKEHYNRVKVVGQYEL